MKDPNHDRTIDYIEFAATDIGATKAFYGGAFGWKFTDYGPDYTSFEDGRLTGGFFKTDSVVPGGPLVVIYSADLESLERAVPEAGGTITRPTFEFPGGRRFHFRDPNGNELAAWSE